MVMGNITLAPHVAIDMPKDHVAIDMPPSPHALSPAGIFPAQTPTATAPHNTLADVGTGPSRAHSNSISPALLQQQKSQLNTVSEVHSPLVNNLTIVRDGEYAHHQNGAEFADFASSVRQHLSELAEVPAGQRLFKTLDYALNGEPSPHHVTIQDAGHADGIRESTSVDQVHHAQQRLSEHGKVAPNIGSSSTVSHHTDYTQHQLQEHAGVSSSDKRDSLVLGHELIHAARAAQGLTATGHTAAGVHKEEVATVGTPDGAEPQWPLTTENALRHEMNERVFHQTHTVNPMNIRDSYAGKKIDS